MLALRAVEGVVGSEQWKVPGMYNGDADAIMSQEEIGSRWSQDRSEEVREGKPVAGVEAGREELVTELWSCGALLARVVCALWVSEATDRQTDNQTASQPYGRIAEEYGRSTEWQPAGKLVPVGGLLFDLLELELRSGFKVRAGLLCLLSFTHALPRLGASREEAFLAGQWKLAKPLLVSAP